MPTYVTEEQVTSLISSVASSVNAKLDKTPTVRVITSSTESLQLSDVGNIVRYEGTVPCNLTIPLEASVSWPVNESINVNNAGTGLITVVESGNTINATPSLVFRAQHSEAVFRYVGSDVWDASGDFAT